MLYENSLAIDQCRHELVKAPYVQTESEIKSRSVRFRTLKREMDGLLGYFFSIHGKPISVG